MKNTACKLTRDKRIRIRVAEDERVAIDTAASLVNKSRNAFIIDTAVHEAKNIILSQCTILLDDASYLEFLKQLEAPLQNVEGRKRLTNLKPEW